MNIDILYDFIDYNNIILLKKNTLILFHILN